MIKLNRQLGLATVLVSALLAGCGGGGGGGGNDAGAPPPGTPTNLSASAVFTYISNLISGTSESGELVDVNALTLAGDDTASPSAVP